MMTVRSQHSGFTLIELIVGMTIFVIGLTGIYALLQTTMTSVVSSRDEIVVAGLLREEIELVMNARDTNLRNFIPWDSAFVESSTQTGFASGIYLIENNFATGVIEIDSSNGQIHQSPIKIIKINTTTPFSTLEEKWNTAQLRIDDHGRYTHDTTGIGTPFASYIVLSPLMISGALVQRDGKPQGWIVDARVIVAHNGRYNEYDAKSMITDWMK